MCSSSVDHVGCGKLTVVAAPLEELIADAVLVRLDSPELTDALSGRQHASEDVSAIFADREADRAQLLELSTLYAEKQITTAEWIDARNRIEARITQGDRRLRTASSNPVLSDLTGQGSTLRASRVSLDLDVQSTIVGVVLDHAVISPGVLGPESSTPAGSDSTCASDQAGAGFRRRWRRSGPGVPPLSSVHTLATTPASLTRNGSPWALQLALTHWINAAPSRTPIAPSPPEVRTSPSSHSKSKLRMPLRPSLQLHDSAQRTASGRKPESVPARSAEQPRSGGGQECDPRQATWPRTSTSTRLPFGLH